METTKELFKKFSKVKKTFINKQIKFFDKYSEAFVNEFHEDEVHKYYCYGYVMKIIDMKPSLHNQFDEEQHVLVLFAGLEGTPNQGKYKRVKISNISKHG